MIEIVLKTELDSSKLNALLSFLKTWGIEAEVKNSKSKKMTNESDFNLSVGLWADLEVDNNTLREKACMRK